MNLKRYCVNEIIILSECDLCLTIAASCLPIYFFLYRERPVQVNSTILRLTSKGAPSVFALGKPWTEIINSPSEVEVFPFGTSAGVNVASVVLGGSTPVIIFEVPTVNGPRLPSLTTFRNVESPSFVVTGVLKCISKLTIMLPLLETKK